MFVLRRALSGSLTRIPGTPIPIYCILNSTPYTVASGVVSVEEGLAGFANEGLLTVAVLFVVAAGISATGGLDWYIGRAYPRVDLVGCELKGHKRNACAL